MRDVLIVDLFEFTHKIRKRNARLEQRAVRILQRSSLLFSKTGAGQSYGIQATHSRRISVTNKERQHILHDLRLPANHRVTTKPHELMRTHVVGQKNVVLDFYMTGQRHFIREDVVVTDDAVVRDVNAHHEEVARADASRLTRAVGAMKRAKLPNNVVVADLEETLLALELDVLRLAADDGVFVNAIARAEPRKALDHGVSADFAVRTDFHVGFDNGGRVDRHL